jgi:hypothetical protein
MLLIAVATGFLALLYDLAFLDQYLTAHPEKPAGQRTSSFQRCRQCARIDLRVCIRGCFLQNSPPGPISSRARRQRRSLHSNSACAHVQAPPLAPSDAVDIAEQGHARLGV